MRLTLAAAWISQKKQNKSYMKKSINSLFVVLLCSSCNYIAESVYSEDYVFKKFNNDSLYNELLDNPTQFQKDKLYSLRDSINSFDSTMNLCIKLLDSLGSLSVLTPPENKREMARNMFHKEKAKLLIRKFNYIQKQFTSLKDSSTYDSLVIKDVSVNLLRMTLEAELENVRIREREFLKGLIQTDQRNKIQ